jgi:hypothetical protein
MARRRSLAGVRFPANRGLNIPQQDPSKGPTMYQPADPYAPGATWSATPPPPNPYASSVPPVDPSLEAYRVAGMRNTALADASAGFQTGQIENQYGLGADVSNPYSQAKLLEDHYKRSQLGTTNSYAAQGQLTSGAYGRMQGENARNYNIGYDQLARAYTGAKGNILLGQLGTYANQLGGVDEQRFASLLRALAGGS